MTRMTSASVGTAFSLEGAEYKVRPACSPIRVIGTWICLTHSVEMTETGHLADHVSTGDEHQLVWNCARHGPEVP